jgi:hypothetical protein
MKMGTSCTRTVIVRFAPGPAVADVVGQESFLLACLLGLLVRAKGLGESYIIRVLLSLFFDIAPLR